MYDLLASAKKLNRIMKADNKAGHQWRYYNGKRSENTFQKTRAAGKYYTNCMGGVVFVCKDAGIPGTALDWYGNKGKINWSNANAKKNAEKYFDILNVKWTLKQAIKYGLVQPGDILTYSAMTHTNMYLGDNKSFDSGHAYCTGSGEGAPFTKWIGALVYSGKKIAYVFRQKSNCVYRVQVGAYNKLENAQERLLDVTAESGFTCFIEQTDMFRVYCGAFERPQNAIDRIKDLVTADITECFITIK